MNGQHQGDNARIRVIVIDVCIVILGIICLVSKISQLQNVWQAVSMWIFLVIAIVVLCLTVASAYSVIRVLRNGNREHASGWWMWRLVAAIVILLGLAVR